MRPQRGYGREFGADGAFQHEISRRYRSERAAVEALLDPQRDAPAELAAASRRCTSGLPHSPRSCGICVRPRTRGGLPSMSPELAMSLAHMHVNRMLRSAQRAQELVLYELLGRAYSSQAARRRR